MWNTSTTTTTDGEKMMACLYLIDEWIPRIVLAMYMQSTHHPLLGEKLFDPHGVCKMES